MADSRDPGVPAIAGAAIAPPIEPMLAKLAEALPESGAFLFEPKWDGFRAIVFRGDGDVFIQSRDLRPLDRYFPELHDCSCGAARPAAWSTARSSSPTPGGLDFDAPAAAPASGRVARREAGGRDAVGVRRLRSARRRRRRTSASCRSTSGARGSSGCSARVEPPVHLTPMTRDRALARRVARALRRRGSRRRHRQADRRHLRAGQARDDQGQARAHRRLRRRRVPLAQERRRQASARCCSASTTIAAGCSTSASRRRSRWPMRKQLAEELAPLRVNALDGHPWRDWAEAARRDAIACPAGRAGGARARICRGSRCGSSASAR